MYSNRVALTGFIGQDAEVKSTRNDTPFTVFSLATKAQLERRRRPVAVGNHLAPLRRFGKARRIRVHPG
jgi:hypothetical protein